MAGVYLHETLKMKAGRIFLLLLCLNVFTFGVIADSPTCPASDLGSGCSDSDEWEGEFFPGIPKIKYEMMMMWVSDFPLFFRSRMRETEREGKKRKVKRGDPFGAPTKNWPWEDGTNSVAMAKRRMRTNFQFINKLGVDRWCFHDRDIALDGKTLEESNKNSDEVVALAKELQGTKIRPLWGTAQLCLHPRYMHDGATSTNMHPQLIVWGESYVFWGGREGYQSLLNTDLGRELDHLRYNLFLEAAVADKKKIGFSGTLLIEPKPQEPTKHQYDWDAATSANFLRKYGLISEFYPLYSRRHPISFVGEFKLNIECNHATLSGHSCYHELETARLNGLLGNFLTDIADATLVMHSVGGIAPGGFNFDAKLRRESTDVEDLFIAHISGMDTLARGLRNVVKLIEDGSLHELVRKRYESFDTEIGALIEYLEKKAIGWGEPRVPSAKLELAEMLFQSVL
ncbi:xylose isomerase-like [Pyrus ussuriensis x Pyrus communis]|uniref:Xylose isomerase n=1 Tax=Pyrus ussuriensis x Pyrus communis TaxID=2448454 RepID=A0A5N5FAU2_9ROSA|nr:xylose isomerase-like [Pyrus ussuriensis x Pyrus communis]